MCEKETHGHNNTEIYPEVQQQHEWRENNEKNVLKYKFLFVPPAAGVCEWLSRDVTTQH